MILKVFKLEKKYLQLCKLFSMLLIHPYTTTHLFLNTEVCVNMLLTPSNCALTKCLRTNRILDDCPRDLRIKPGQTCQHMHTGNPTKPLINVFCGYHKYF